MCDISTLHDIIKPCKCKRAVWPTSSFLITSNDTPACWAEDEAACRVLWVVNNSVLIDPSFLHDWFNPSANIICLDALL